MNSVGPSIGLVHGTPQTSRPCPWRCSPLPHNVTLIPLVWNTREKIHRIDSLNQATSKHPYPANLLSPVFWTWGALAINVVDSKLVEPLEALGEGQHHGGRPGPRTSGAIHMFNMAGTLGSYRSYLSM